MVAFHPFAPVPTGDRPRHATESRRAWRTWRIVMTPSS